MARHPDILIVGTDTGVGKSVVSLLTLRLFFDAGLRPFYVKPFQTGCRNAQDRDSDAAFVYRHTPQLSRRDPAQSVICCHASAKAPLFAARDDGQRIDLETVLDEVDRLRSAFEPLVVEAAGGLMVPVTRELMVVDLIERFQCRPLLVARAGLGTINHTLLSLEAMQRRGAPPMGVVLVANPGAAEDPALVSENITAIERYGRADVGGVIPWIENFSAIPDAADAPLRQILGIAGPSAGPAV